MVSLPFADVVDTVAEVLVDRGYAPGCARVLADNCVSAQRDGSVSHGLFRVQGYVDCIESGYVNGDPRPRVHDVAPAFVRVDADNGFAQVALAAARDLLVDKARHCGVAVLAVRRSHHLAALYLDVEPFAAEGLVALTVVNSGPSVAPYGGHRAVFGTDPMAFAAPRENGAALVFDQASSTIARGDLQIAAREGHELDPATGIDSHGHPTGDPQAILDGGALATFGLHKGTAIALMVEILCAGLVGADFSFEVPADRPAGVASARTGQTFIVIDPRVGADSLPPLAGRVEALVHELKAAGQPRIPGERRAQRRAQVGDVVEIDDRLWSEVEALRRPEQ